MREIIKSNMRSGLVALVFAAAVHGLATASGRVRCVTGFP